MPKKPTGKGNCYEKALKYLLDHDFRGFYLVHGEATGRGPIKGIKYGHAWVEDNNKRMAFDFDKNSPRLLPTNFYYQLGKIEADKVKRYTIKEATKLALETRHYGPWE